MNRQVKLKQADYLANRSPLTEKISRILEDFAEDSRQAELGGTLEYNKMAYALKIIEVVNKAAPEAKL